MGKLENIHDGGLELLFDGLPLNFRVMNMPLSVDTQMEFMEVMKNLDEQESVEDWKTCEARLFNPETPLNEQKTLLAQLTLVDDVEVMRALERYAESCPAEVKDFAKMAAYQSKLFLEAAILGENQVVVASGLGGEGEKMRFFVALQSRNHKPLSAVQQRIVQKETAYQLKQYNVVAESVTFEGCYVKVIALIPMRTGVHRMFQQCIDACNELGEFLEKNMVISTVKVLNAEELDEITKEGQAAR